ncbi:dentin matrix acidic phosphoprotein 1 [Struthio camelus]|uniref:dentin matrix acidic phosphoprotein 1 n=1 Tax=Struthio camelus TaxID=8801 RepID=UPI00051E1C09|nr:PREDICTED: dentin matrix acidic phosphoprotein 1 [Struthio camelus australis]XP_009674807.1 PREDICTED: dentin matrix acidic phosphoprotein 1 [Struthio camelus australis]XP_009674808.1 PREDICTED: dentin matrix acidic phosphoprotein 1 [Struthio camelus australis]XP_009674809.1 PREDICTED: dentin matrix acidic phosphoprotein 1 [Struthio camelus australis]XP_009674810.1 PREDICTED: dentin matrix acidic phosphoprotein 1 [Struthio camelus australis]XP_009674811.1 PREDICTED: dentin matrix acidic pho
MKTAFLIIFLWALAYAHPVPNHMSAHPRSSAKLEDTVSEDNMNELADWDDGQDRSPHASRERGDIDVAGDSHDPADGNDVDEEIAEHNGGAERIRIREAQHKNWVDHEDTSDLDEVEDQHENGLGQHLDEKRFLEEDVHDADNGDQGERYGAESHGSKRYDVGDNRLLYRPTGFFPRGGYRGRSDLVDEEDDSGDDTFDEDEGEEKGEGPTYTVRPNEAGEHDTFGDNDQNGGRRDTGMSRRPHDDSSSSSSESRSLDHREYKNYIASRYGRTYRRRGDSDSSSQEERYDFDNEEMQGDDPSIFDGFGSYSKGLRTAFRSKESSQESSREAGKAVLKVSDQSEEESRSEEFPNGPDDSEEDDSLQHDDSESVEVGDADSREDSQSAEDKSESEEHVTSQSKENSADKSGEDADSRSREDGDSKSREELASQSDEENRSRESQEEDSKEAVSKSSERSGSKSEEGQEDRESAEDNSKPSGLDSESAEDEGDQSESREESESPEDSLESEEDGNDSHPGEDALSRSKSTESQSASHEGASSEEGPTTDSRDGEDSTSAESRNSDSKEEEHSHSAEEDSQSREDATNESAGHGDDSLPRSLEGENRKRRLRVYHDKHVGDYDDTDCQDGY